MPPVCTGTYLAALASSVAIASASGSSAALRVSESTVKAHIGRILAKLDLAGRVQAVILAYELGVVAPGT